MRYRILRPSTDITEPKDITTTLSAALTGVYYWLYDNRTPQPEPKSTWQNMFAGRRHDSIQEHDLLLLNDSEDATEINNSQVFEAVVARASTEQQQDRDNNTIK